MPEVDFFFWFSPSPHLKFPHIPFLFVSLIKNSILLVRFVRFLCSLILNLNFLHLKFFFITYVALMWFFSLYMSVELDRKASSPSELTTLRFFLYIHTYILSQNRFLWNTIIIINPINNRGVIIFIFDFCSLSNSKSLTLWFSLGLTQFLLCTLYVSQDKVI